jgi:hypothetical protein
LAKAAVADWSAVGVFLALSGLERERYFKELGGAIKLTPSTCTHFKILEESVRSECNNNKLTRALAHLLKFPEVRGMNQSESVGSR